MTRWTHRPAALGWARRLWSRVGAFAGVVVLAAACQATGAGGVPRSDATLEPGGPVVAVASATGAAVSNPSPEPTPTAAAPVDPGVVSAGPPTAFDPRADGLDVVFEEYAITLEARVIRPGRVTLVVHDAGLLAHGLEMKLEGSGSGRDRTKIETRTFRSGETLRVEADLVPGVYEIECYVADHAARGMRTTLEVRADAPLVRAAASASAPGRVRIVQFAFVAASVDVPVGTRVTWTNQDPTPHTVTETGGAFDSRQLDPGAAFSVVLDGPGTYTYHCDIHPTMVGTVRVR